MAITKWTNIKPNKYHYNSISDAKYTWYCFDYDQYVGACIWVLLLPLMVVFDDAITIKNYMYAQLYIVWVMSSAI